MSQNIEYGLIDISHLAVKSGLTTLAHLVRFSPEVMFFCELLVLLNGSITRTLLWKRSAGMNFFTT